MPSFLLFSSFSWQSRCWCTSSFLRWVVHLSFHHMLMLHSCMAHWSLGIFLLIFKYSMMIPALLLIRQYSKRLHNIIRILYTIATGFLDSTQCNIITSFLQSNANRREHHTYCSTFIDSYFFGSDKPCKYRHYDIASLSKAKLQKRRDKTHISRS